MANDNKNYLYGDKIAHLFSENILFDRYIWNGLKNDIFKYYQNTYIVNYDTHNLTFIHK